MMIAAVVLAVAVVKADNNDDGMGVKRLNNITSRMNTTLHTNPSPCQLTEGGRRLEGSD